MTPNHSLTATITLAIVFMSVVACAGQKNRVKSPGGTVNDYASLIVALRRNGLKVKPAEKISQPFFSVKGRTVKINNSDVQVFEYKNADVAKSEAARISPDGSTVGTSKMTWVETPHFYQKDKLIVLYVGADQVVLTALKDVLGPQIAGGR